jgi:hypothetical protein
MARSLLATHFTAPQRAGTSPLARSLLAAHTTAAQYAPPASSLLAKKFYISYLTMFCRLVACSPGLFRSGHHRTSHIPAMSLLAVPVQLVYPRTTHTQARSLLAVIGITSIKLIIHDLSDILASSLLAQTPYLPIQTANSKNRPGCCS